MSVIDTAITRLQEIAAALVEDIKLTPLYPIETPDVLPLAIANVTEGNGRADDASDVHIFVTVAVDFHFSRTSLPTAYKQMYAVIPEYLQRLGGDPNLAGKVATIVFPVTFVISPAEYGNITTQMLSFNVTLKFREDPTTTA